MFHKIKGILLSKYLILLLKENYLMNNNKGILYKKIIHY